ncbi:MAG: hypothetical protein HY725_03360 [Candidatus Rokubacteria bacterium]|nr:hypothetical protein [Candidatus Rokubacteria bacterium]
MTRAPFTLLLGFAFALILPAGAAADRIFYRGEIWLETSPSVQHLSLVGVLRAWEEVAAEVRKPARAGETPSGRQREVLRLHECLTAGSRRSTEELLQVVVTTFGALEPERVFYSLSEFIAEALRELCRSRGGLGEHSPSGKVTHSVSRRP